MNIKICTKCGEIKLDQIDFRIRWRKRANRFSYRCQCKKCEDQRHYKNHCNVKEGNYIGIIYKATNKINGKSYIGQTIKTLEERKNAHLKATKYPKKPYFHKALKKYGFDYFEWSILEENNNLNLAEQWYIRKFDTYENGYNSTTGGASFSFTDKTKEKMREARIKYFRNPENRRANGLAQIKRYEDPEERLKTSIQQKKRFTNPEELKKHSIASSKEFIIINPYLDKIYNIKNLKKHCEEIGLNPGCMSWVAKGKHNNHKGFGCKHIPCILYKNQINNTFSLFFW